MDSSFSNADEDYQLEEQILVDLLNDNQQWLINNRGQEMQQQQLDALLHILVPQNYRNQPGRPYHVFQHAEALHCVQWDYLGNDALFSGKHFEMMFHLSRTRVQRILQDIGNARIAFISIQLMLQGNQGHPWKRECCYLSRRMHMEFPLIHSQTTFRCWLTLQRNVVEILTLQ
jgi:hypothetical protein